MYVTFAQICARVAAGTWQAQKHIYIYFRTSHAVVTAMSPVSLYPVYRGTRRLRKQINNVVATSLVVTDDLRQLGIAAQTKSPSL